MKAAFAAMDRRLDLASAAPIAVALSGGGDSLALLHLSLDWARRNGRKVLALTVDHDLHPDSARWTAEAGDKARALGADWRGLAWTGPKPSAGLQAKARAARHALLAVATREAGARVLLMGHTADDIAEAELMREADAPGIGRVREWAPSPVWPEGRGVMLLRPLLGIERKELRTHLTARDETWLDDPANTNPRFARVRARQHLAAHSREDGSPGFLEPQREAVQSWLPAFAGMSGGGVGGFARTVTFTEGEALMPAPIPGQALAAALLCVAGQTRPPRGPALARLQAVIEAKGVATLAACRVDARGATVRISRAPPRRGQVSRPLEPSAWVASRFYAACGLYEAEAALPSV